MKLKPLFILFIPIFIYACSGADKEKTDGDVSFSTASLSSPQIAGGFRVTENGHVNRVELFNPWDSAFPAQKLYLLPKGRDDFEVPDGEVIEVPAKRIVCMSASQLSYLDALDEIDAVVGVSDADYFVSQDFRDLISNGKVSEIGIGEQFKLEELINLSPDLILVSPQKGQNFQPLINAGLTVVPFGEYLEPHPLGRAEWIKFTGLLTGKEELSIQMFDSIAKQYNQLKQMASTVSNRPTVLTGKQYGGFWNLSGGRSYEAQFLSDAGADYLWSDDLSTGGIMLDFETVYERGMQADYWRFLVYSESEYSYQDLSEEDARYTDFDAFKQKKVIICNTLKKPFFEKGFLEPQIILADYIHIFHPELLPDHENVYYEFIK